VVQEADLFLAGKMLGFDIPIGAQAGSTRRFATMRGCARDRRVALWRVDAVTVIARFDISPGQELAIDYALFTVQNDWSMNAVCNCVVQVCRRTITANDWKLLDVQNRYHNHFSPFLNERIKQTRIRS
jgi:hypothetical protein